jgi:AhpD family alkylhydroperoxidase
MTMAGRTSLNTAVPEAYASTLALSEQTERAALAAGVDGSTLELVRLRVSQLNGCGYCLRMHARDAIAKGETTDRIAVLPAWRETAYFSPAERAALAIAEEITHIGTTVAAADDDALTKDQAAAIRWVAIVINSFNRIAISSHYVVKP